MSSIKFVTNVANVERSAFSLRSFAIIIIFFVRRIRMRRENGRASIIFRFQFQRIAVSG